MEKVPRKYRKKSPPEKPAVCDDWTMTTKEAAIYLGMHPSRLSKLRVRGQGPKYGRWTDATNSKVFYWKEDIDEWRASRVALSLSEERTRDTWKERKERESK